MHYFHIKTWGCQMNYADTEKIRHVFYEAGYHESKLIDEADVIILNTCSVRQRAEDKVLGLARRIMKLKERRRELKVLLTGCMANRYVRSGGKGVPDLSYQRSLRLKMPWLDGIFKIGDLDELRKLAGITPLKRVASVRRIPEQAYESKISAFVPISQGCDNFCSYCIVPYSRGKEVNRPFDEIACQCSKLVSSTYRMITLLGQNVNSWTGTISGKPARFAQLLQKIDEIEGIYWLTFLTAHPKDMTDELADVLANGTHLCPYMNLPIQSGSDAILRRMNRKYTRGEYLKKVAVLRKKIPHIRLSTDIIVGFPGEIQKDFEQTVSVLKEVRFGMVYVSEYSSRSSSVSARMDDSVPAELKGLRKQELESIQRAIIEDQNRKDIGKVLEILVTGNGKGKTRDLREVTFHVQDNAELGDFRNVRVEAASASGLQVAFDV